MHNIDKTCSGLNSCCFPAALVALVATAILLVPLDSLRAAQSLPVTPKWSVFEQEFTSSVPYSNPIQQATLTVTFQSPAGDSLRTEGFWDGGRTWRVRFTPNTLGKWSYKTSCSDAGNSGLHGQSGQFLCSAALGQNAFQVNGYLRAARGKRYFEHADGTPFFWTGDTAWEAARNSTLKDWQFYGFIRNSQGFNVTTWSVAPGRDASGETATTGFHDQIGINVPFFRELDSKIITLSQLGLLSVICPLLESDLQPKATKLSDEQATLLARYAVARWGAYPVAWLVSFDPDPQGRNVDRWKKIGRAAFASDWRNPVLVHARTHAWLMKEFRGEPWVDGFGFEPLAGLNDDAFKFAASGPFTQEVSASPAKPVVPFTPLENSTAPGGDARYTAAHIRQAAWWGMLMNAAAGFNYGASAVSAWDTRKTAAGGEELPLWHLSLFLPGAKDTSRAANLMSSLDFWSLEPRLQLVVQLPEQTGPGRHIAAAAAGEQDQVVVYTPAEGAVQLKSVPKNASVSWFNPRTGHKELAVAKSDGATTQFSTPGPGDWVLVVQPRR